MAELRMSLQSPVIALVLALALLAPRPGMSAPQGEPVDVFDLENYDLTNEMDWESWNDKVYDYDDLDQEIEVGTVAPDNPSPKSQPLTEEEEVKEVMSTPAPPPVTLDFKGPGLFGHDTGTGMPTCLLCVCIRESVYCDDAGLVQIPPLPKDTTHFYGRFNKITHIKERDFMNLKKLQSIDLTGNQIAEMDEDVFRPLQQLKVIVLADNKLQVMPELPTTMKHIDVRNNRLISRGIHLEMFKDMNQLEFVYLSDNKLDYIPTPLPLSLRVLHLQNNNIQFLHEDTFCNSHDRTFIRYNLEDIRLDGNPLNINHFAQAYNCLRRMPIGNH